jgi:short subunit dehydrogenase-like uncharacterized protein
VARLDDPGALTAALAGASAVLNAAGPFAETAAPVVDACLRAGVHYLDVTGEVPVLDAVAQRHADAVGRGVMLMPAVGFDVVPSDCLAAHLARRLPRMARLALGVRGLELLSRGSARTLADVAASRPRVRRHGELVAVDPGAVEHVFDFGDGPRICAAVSWGDLVTAHYTTGSPNVEVYFEATPGVRAMLAAARWGGWLLATPPWRTWMRAAADLLPEGPTAEERARTTIVVVAEGWDHEGRRAAARLRTPDAYDVTAAAATAVLARVAAGDVEPGFQTPGRHFGPDFVLGLPGVIREDVT